MRSRLRTVSDETERAGLSIDRGTGARESMTMTITTLSGRTKIADLLAMPGTEDIELQIVRSREMARPGDFS